MMGRNRLREYPFDYCSTLETIIEDLPIPISIVGRDESFVLVNRAYEEMFQIQREMLLGKHYSSHVKENEKSIHQVVLQQKKPYSGTKSMGKQNRLVEVEGVPLVVDGTLWGSMAIIYEFFTIERTMTALEETRRTLQELGSEQAKYSFKDILFCSAAMSHAVEGAKMAAATNVTVLLRGESGTGKELFAHAIQRESARRKHKFVRINCTALPESLLESVLFGYEDSAFTGAKKGGEIGLFEAADGGTIFLDEVGDIGLSLQSKLLRVLQEREITRVGGTRATIVNVRVVAATNANLEEKIEKKEFRSDLYYRLNMFPVFVPPLRGRKEDIPLLADYFLQRYAVEFGRKASAFEEGAIRLLAAYDWPGNVRELENTIARTVINIQPSQKAVREADIQLPGSGNSAPEALFSRMTEATAKEDYQTLFQKWEGAMLSAVFQQEKRCKSKMARRLDISVRSVYEKLKKYGIE